MLKFMQIVLYVIRIDKSSYFVDDFLSGGNQMAIENVSSKGYLFEDFRLFHNRDMLGVQTVLHFHTFYKVTIVKQGNGTYMIDGRSYDILPGDIILVGMNIPHQPYFSKGELYDRYTLYISDTMINNFDSPDFDLSALFNDPSKHILRLSPAYFDMITDLVKETETELASSSFGSSLLSKLDVCRILISLGRSSETTGAGSAVRHNENDKMLSLLRYINTHINEDLSIEELSERFFLSRYHLMRLFKITFGFTIHDYITKRRLINAREKILNGDTPAEACYSCGFGSYSAFARAYRAKYGISPGKTGKTDRPESGVGEFFPE